MIDSLKQTEHITVTVETLIEEHARLLYFPIFAIRLKSLIGVCSFIKILESKPPNCVSSLLFLQNLLTIIQNKKEIQRHPISVIIIYLYIFHKY